MSAKLRLLYTSNAFWSTSGYGVQGRSLLTRLAELPEFGGRENIANFAWYGLEGGCHNVDGFMVYPRFDDPYGNDVLAAHSVHFGANVVISLIDVWVLQEPAKRVYPALFCPWLPIDHDPVPDPFLRALEGAHLPLTYAKWGHEMLTKAGVENVYIPHGIEPSVYRVIEDREEVRKFKRWLTKSEESHLTVMVSANKGFPSRKFFEGQLEAFRDFAQDKPEAKLYVHSLPTAVHGGVDFNILVRLLGLEGRVIFPQPYLYRLGYPPEHLALIYNAADAFLGASMSEGFGIPIVEAQACGTPVIVTNFSAMPELVRWGYAAQVEHRVLTGMHSYQAWPDVADITDKLNRLYEAWLINGGDWPLAQRLKTQNAIHAEYSWDIIVRDHWSPLMARLADEAPPLLPRFGGVELAQPLQDDVASFVETVNQGVAQEQPRKRVAPLSPVSPKEAHAIMDEVAIDNISGHRRSFDELRLAANGNGEAVLA